MQNWFRNARQNAFLLQHPQLVKKILSSNFVELIKYKCRTFRTNPVAVMELEKINRTNRILAFFLRFSNSSTNQFSRAFVVRLSSIKFVD